MYVMANPVESVGNDRFIPASAHNNTKKVPTFGNGPCRGADKIRIVYRCVGMGSGILNRDCFSLKVGLQRELVLESGMVVCYGDGWHCFIL